MSLSAINPFAMPIRETGGEGVTARGAHLFKALPSSAVTVYHVAMTVLFTVLSTATLFQSETVNNWRVSQWSGVKDNAYAVKAHLYGVIDPTGADDMLKPKIGDNLPALPKWTVQKILSVLDQTFMKSATDADVTGQIGKGAMGGLLLLGATTGAVTIPVAFTLGSIPIRGFKTMGVNGAIKTLFGAYVFHKMPFIHTVLSMGWNSTWTLLNLASTHASTVNDALNKAGDVLSAAKDFVQHPKTQAVVLTFGKVAGAVGGAASSVGGAISSGASTAADVITSPKLGEFATSAVDTTAAAWDWTSWTGGHIGNFITSPYTLGTVCSVIGLNTVWWVGSKGVPALKVKVWDHGIKAFYHWACPTIIAWPVEKLAKHVFCRCLYKESKESAALRLTGKWVVVDEQLIGVMSKDASAGKTYYMYIDKDKVLKGRTDDSEGVSLTKLASGAFELPEGTLPWKEIESSHQTFLRSSKDDKELEYVKLSGSKTTTTAVSDAKAQKSAKAKEERNSKRAVVVAAPVRRRAAGDSDSEASGSESDGPGRAAKPVRADRVKKAKGKEAPKAASSAASDAPPAS